MAYMGSCASAYVRDSWDGVASSPLAQSKAIFAFSSNHHTVQPTGAGLLILSSERSTLEQAVLCVLMKLETSCSGVLISFFLPRQQALFHVLSAYSVYNTVSSKSTYALYIFIHM